MEAQPIHPTGSRAPTLEERLTHELPALVGFLRRILGPEAREADDLSQEVAARALAYGGSFEAGRPLGPWLRRAALRVVIDDRARRGRMPTSVEADAERIDPAGDPAEHSDRRDQLAHLLSRLPELERRVLVRFHRDGASLRDLAEELGLPIGTLKSHLHRARQRLVRGAPQGPEGPKSSVGPNDPVSPEGTEPAT